MLTTLNNEREVKEMEFNQGKQICDNCYEKIYGRNCGDFGHRAMMEYTSMGTNKENQIIWYECGHVYIVKDGITVQQFNYGKE